jgi:hypothetical protein
LISIRPKTICHDRKSGSMMPIKCVIDENIMGKH